MITKESIPEKLDVILSFDGGELRPLQPEDVNLDYVKGLNDPLVNKYLVSVKKHHQTLETVLDFIVQCNNDPHGILFGIWPDKENQHCGTVRLHGIEYDNQTAIMGICIFNRRFWGRGLASASIRRVTQWALDDLNLRWIEAGLYADNIASAHVFMSAGFHKAIYIEDKYLLNNKPAPVDIYVAKKGIWGIG